jgi:hypothetical protein
LRRLAPNRFPRTRHSAADGDVFDRQHTFFLDFFTNAPRAERFRSRLAQTSALDSAASRGCGESMRVRSWVIVLAVFAAADACAAELTVTIDDGRGHPAPDAIVSLRREDAS